MPTPKKPQDRLPKLPKGYTFEGADSQLYTLPAPAGALDNIPGRAVRDAAMQGGDAELRLGFLCLEASGVDDDALEGRSSTTGPRAFTNRSTCPTAGPALARGV
jgi:hypothetical protein